MVYNVSNFEGDTIGQVPAGWRKVEGDVVEVTDEDAIQGDKSLLVRDETADFTRAATSVSDGEDIVFAADINRDAPLVGEFRQYGFAGRGSSNVVWNFLFAGDDESGNPFDVYFATTEQNAEPSGSEPLGDLVGRVSAGFHDIRIENPSTSLRIVVDGNVLHDTGNGYSGVDEFWATVDDANLLLDSNVGYSTFVYHEGSRVIVNSNDQTFTFETSGATNPISDRGASPFAYIEGNAIDYEQ